jgi:hypothetical protein
MRDELTFREVRIRLDRTSSTASNEEDPYADISTGLKHTSVLIKPCRIDMPHTSNRFLLLSWECGHVEGTPLLPPDRRDRTPLASVKAIVQILTQMCEKRTLELPKSAPYISH